MGVAGLAGRSWLAAFAIILTLGAIAAPRASAQDAKSDTVKRGAYLVFAGGCISCHTDTKKKGPLLAGGAPLKTPFGTFYAPNITPHREHGIGGWSDGDFIRAMRKGVRPDGAHYFPVFPYTSFTNMTDRDVLDLKAYLFSLKPVARPNRPHDIKFPFGWRFVQLFWKWINFEEGPMKPDPGRSEKWNRGAYLVKALAHCTECHTPRASHGGLNLKMWMAGVVDGPEGETAPNITPDSETGIGSWSPDDIATYLKTGLDPEGDFVGSLMADVVEHNTSNLTDKDILTIVEYLKALPAIRNRIGKPSK